MIARLRHGGPEGAPLGPILVPRSRVCQDGFPGAKAGCQESGLALPLTGCVNMGVSDGRKVWGYVAMMAVLAALDGEFIV